MSLLFAVLAALLYGGADFAGGYASRRTSVFTVLVLSQIAGSLVALIAAPILGPNAPTQADLLWGVLGGACGSLGLFFLYYGIAKSVVAIVSPVSALVGALVPMLFGLFLGETPSVPAWVGAGLCLPAVLLLSYEPAGSDALREVRKALLFGLLAGLGFGGFFIAVSRPAADAGLWPLVTARCASILAISVATLIARTPPRLGSASLWIVLAAGICDMGANIAFVLASREGLLILVTIITSLFPGPTVLLARIFMHQRLGPVRLLGFLSALAGVALIGVG